MYFILYDKCRRDLPKHAIYLLKRLIEQSRPSVVVEVVL